MIFSAERDRDGDYALMDLTAARERPFVRAARLRGLYPSRRPRHHRDAARRRRAGLVHQQHGIRQLGDRGRHRPRLHARCRWRRGTTPRTTCSSRRRFALASPPNAPVQLSDTMTMKWQSGVTLFTQGYEQLAVNSLAPFLLSPQLGIPVQQYSPDSSLDDLGMGIFGQAVFTLHDRSWISRSAAASTTKPRRHVLDSLSRAGHRPADHGRLATRATRTSRRRWRWAIACSPTSWLYASVSEGFKAGGWNPASPTGSEAYGEEHAWHFESGVKGGFAGGRVAASAAVFYIDWADLQLNVPNPFVPGQFYIANVGEARQQRRRVRTDRQAAPDGGALRQRRLHQRPVRRRQRLQRRRRVGQPDPEHARPTPPRSAPTSSTR